MQLLRCEQVLLGLLGGSPPVEGRAHGCGDVAFEAGHRVTRGLQRLMQALDVAAEALKTCVGRGQRRAHEHEDIRLRGNVVLGCARPIFEHCALVHEREQLRVGLVLRVLARGVARHRRRRILAVFGLGGRLRRRGRPQDAAQRQGRLKLRDARSQRRDVRLSALLRLHCRA